MIEIRTYWSGGKWCSAFSSHCCWNLDNDHSPFLGLGKTKEESLSDLERQLENLKKEIEEYFND